MYIRDKKTGKWWVLSVYIRDKKNATLGYEEDLDYYNATPFPAILCKLCSL